MRITYSAICNKHGYHLGGDCPKCEDDWKNEVFMTPKDKLYDFYSVALDKKIESKTQWKRELKARGLTDDFNQSYKGRLKDIENYKAPSPKMSREEIKNHIRQEMKSKGLYDRSKLFTDKPRRVWVAD